jgi:hypothetical protein
VGKRVDVLYKVVLSGGCSTIYRKVLLFMGSKD